MQVVATAGHVDHGKSTLLRALTGMEPDRWQEERDRGLTIDLGFVWTDLAPGEEDPLTVAFVDVPGHERFIANMLAGAGAVRQVLFVVAADDGWSAQSQEHLDILELLGVRHGLVAVTKTDLAGSERAHTVAEDVRRHLSGTGLAEAPLVLTDAVSGRGLDELTEQLRTQVAAAPRPDDRNRARLWVDRAFTISGAGTVVTGTLQGGALDVGADAVILPQRRATRIRSLQALGAPIERAGPGARVAANLPGLSPDELGRGDALVTSRAPWLVTEAADVWTRALPGHDVDRTGAWHLHVGSAEVLCSVYPLLGEPIPGGSEGWVRLELETPLPLVSGDRFVLREAGRRATVGGGEIVDPDPGSRVRGLEQRLERIEALEQVLLSDDRLPPLVAAAGGARPAERALAAAGHPPDTPLPDGLLRLSDHVVERGALTRWRDAVLERVRAHHEQQPSSPGLDRVALAGTVRGAGSPADLAGAVVDHLADEGVLHRSGSHYAAADQAARVDAAAQRRVEQLVELLSEEPLSPPKLEEAAEQTGVDYQQLQRAEQAGLIAAAVDEAIARLRTLARQEGAFTAAQAKDAWGTTRRYAIPLLEHLDAIGVTDFDGKLRTLRHAGR